MKFHQEDLKQISSLIEKDNMFNLDPDNSSSLTNEEVAELYTYYQEMYRLSLADSKLAMISDWTIIRSQSYWNILAARDCLDILK